MSFGFNQRKPDPRGQYIHFVRYAHRWYLEWYASEARKGAPLARRPAHDTEVTLIDRIRDLEQAMGAPKDPTSLGLTRTADLGLLRPVKINYSTTKKGTPRP